MYDGSALTLEQVKCYVPVKRGEPKAKDPSTSATRALLDECVAMKTGPKFKATTELLGKVCSSLHMQGFTSMTVEECKRIVKRLNEQYRRNPARNEWRDHMAYLRGDSDIQPPRHDPQLSPDAVPACALITNPEVFSARPLSKLAVACWSTFLPVSKN